MCTRVPSTPEGFKHCCRYCGQGFTTSVGLQYVSISQDDPSCNSHQNSPLTNTIACRQHLNNKVCGDFGATPAQIQHGVSPPAVSVAQEPLAGVRPSPPTATPQAKYIPVTAPATPSGAPNLLGRTASGADPYAHLTPEQRASLNEELRQAEITFAERFRQADAIKDPNERRVRLDGLRNSFGTKQSIIRKKYGVKLRERRTKAEIDAERARMGRTAEMDGVAEPPPPPPPPNSARNISNVSRVWTAQQASASSGPSPAPATPRGNRSGGQATSTRNSDGRVSVKREMQNDGDDDEDNKRRKLSNNTTHLNSTSGSEAPLSAQATASSAIHVYEQAGARVEIHTPSGSAARSASAELVSDSSGTPDLEAQIVSEVAAAAAQHRDAEAPRTVHEIEDDNEENDDEDEDDEDGNEDIPSTLPPTVRQNLGSASRLTA